MADSFADLWNSTAPSKSAAPKTLGSVSAQQNSSTVRRPQNDVFSLLSSASSGSNPNSRSISPAVASLKPISSQKGTTRSGSAMSGQMDAFSGLLSGSTLDSGGSNGTNMTIAERAAKAEQEKREHLLRHKESLRTQASAWDGLDTLASTSSTNPPMLSIPNQLHDDWGFGSSTSPASQITPSTSYALDDDWDLSGFSSTKPASKSPAPVAEPTPAPVTQGSLWDLDEFSSTTSHSSPPATKGKDSPQRSNTPGDFDFGDREDGLMDDSGDEYDILGALSKPVDELSKRSSPSVRATPSPQPLRSDAPRPPSPPPHIVGQIVEMGFSPQQARSALFATATGLDVQAALETLLANDASSVPTQRQSPTRRSPPQRGQDDERLSAHRSRDPNSRARPKDTAGMSPEQVKLHEQADKLLAQASEIGISVFNRANAFWNTGKEKVQKVYEERAARAAAAENGAAGRDGKPRWMQEAAAREYDAEHPELRGGRFTENDEHDEVIPPKPPRPRPNGALNPVAAQQLPSPKTEDLLTDAPTSFYVSPFRRGRPPAPPATTPPTAPIRAPSPIALTQRQAVPATRAAIMLSAEHKSSGTELFKLGRYADAAAAYTKAIDVLSEGHLLQVPLLTNRALARLRTGEYGGAVEDCSVAVKIVGAGYHPTQEARVERVEDGAGVDLGEGLVKAWKRRAEANEGRERWEEARKDWECVAGLDWAGGKVRSEAVNGAGRCRKMIAGGSAQAERKMPMPPVKKFSSVVQSARHGPTPPSEALNKLREANNATEAEDQARHELKDSVDARLVAWKGGKETNIRALIASLETVLWPELEWQKVGMGGLVSAGQVKVRYTKAIAKLHPDKLNAGNTTLEQRMIANGVFGALNEAWNTFKQ